MPNQTVTDSAITVHGRGSLNLPYKVKDETSDEQIDISNWIVYFEVDGVPIREQLLPDPSDPKGLLLKLERNQVASLSKTPTRFAVVDENLMAEGMPYVLWEGTIGRTGYVGDPDTKNDD